MSAMRDRRDEGIEEKRKKKSVFSGVCVCTSSLIILLLEEWLLQVDMERRKEEGRQVCSIESSWMVPHCIFVQPLPSSHFIPSSLPSSAILFLHHYCAFWLCHCFGKRNEIRRDESCGQSACVANRSSDDEDEERLKAIIFSVLPLLPVFFSSVMISFPLHSSPLFCSLLFSSSSFMPSCV